MKKNSIISSEDDLIGRLKTGDVRAVREWFVLYMPQIVGFISQRVSLPEDVEELAQQTFMDCLQQLPLFLGHSSLGTWMLAIAKHAIGDYYRKKYAKRTIKTIPLVSALLSTPLVDAHGVSHKVQTVLRRMSTHSKELLLQKYVDQKKVLHIALNMGKTVKAVESELFRARREFRLLFINERD